MPASGLNMAYLNDGTIGASDGNIYITIDREHGAKPTDEYVRELREILPKTFPTAQFSFLPADIVSQILNFGSPAPLDVQISGPNRDANQALAFRMLRDIGAVRGAADVRILQSSRNPELRVDVDRTRIGQIGLNERDVTNNLGTTLAGTSQSSPLFWLNPVNGVVYPIVVQAPEYRIGSVSDLANIPVARTGSATQVLGGLGSVSRKFNDAVVSHYNILPSFDIYAAVQGRDLGGVAADMQKVIDRYKGQLPKGSTMTLRGQIQTMNTAFSGLFIGILGAIVLIYLIIVVNFQSWLDPFVIITALPAALAGIVWTLFATGTTLSVPALTGAIMCMGVATANSILVVSFARERLNEHGDAVVAAVEAGFTRFRPVLIDGPGHGHRHAAHGAGARRGRGAERPARPRGDRRPDLRHRRHPVLRPRRLQSRPRAQARGPGLARAGRGSLRRRSRLCRPIVPTCCAIRRRATSGWSA